MEDLKEILLKIKDNSGKYIGETSLNRLDHFILGYTLSQLDEMGTSSGWLKKFQDFVQQKYNVSYSFRFSKIIRYFSTSDDDAFYLFYELLDEFIAKSNKEGMF